METPKFSIIVINYNYSRYLQEAILSALAIDYDNKEVIVIDDGSSDDSARVIEHFGNRIIPIFKTNGGALSCVNVSFCYSTGDILIFLDADDRISPNVAIRILPAWERGVTKVQYLSNVIDANGVSL